MRKLTLNWHPNWQHLALWAAMILALVGSLRHVAWAFSTLEEGRWLPGYVQAVAVDLGLVALAYGVQIKRRAGQSARWLWVGVLLFSAVSTYANLLHGMQFASAMPSLGALAAARPAVLSAVLPLLVLYLAEIVSADAPQGATADLHEPARNAAPNLSAEHEQWQKWQSDGLWHYSKTKTKYEPAQAEQDAPQSVVVCQQCQRTFDSANALRAHKRFCKGTSAPVMLVSRNGKGHKGAS